MRRSRLSSAITFAAVQLLVVVGLFVALAGSAFAQSPSSAVDQYGTKVKGVQVQQAQTQVAGEESGLPNTGLSLLGVVLAGAALVATGVAVRRRERKDG